MHAFELLNLQRRECGIRKKERGKMKTEKTYKELFDWEI